MVHEERIVEHVDSQGTQILSVVFALLLVLVVVLVLVLLVLVLVVVLVLVLLVLVLLFLPRQGRFSCSLRRPRRPPLSLALWQTPRALVVHKSPSLRGHEQQCWQPRHLVGLFAAAWNHNVDSRRAKAAGQRQRSKTLARSAGARSSIVCGRGEDDGGAWSCGLGGYVLSSKQGNFEAQHGEAQRSHLQTFPPYPTTVPSISSSSVPVVRARPVALGLNIPSLFIVHGSQVRLWL